MINNANDLLTTVKMVKQSKKITNLELSALSGVPLGTVNKILCGQTKNLKLETLSKLYSALTCGDAIEDVGCESFGFSKVGSCVFDVKLGAPSENAKFIISAIDKANKQGVKLLVFPKLCLTGSTMGDIFYQPTLLSSAKAMLFEIASKTHNANVISIVGLPLMVDGNLYNVGAVICKGRVLGFVPSLVQDRQFSSFNGVKTIVIGGIEYPFGNLCFKCKETPELTFDVRFDEGLVSTCNAPVTVTAMLSSLPETVGSYERVLELAKSSSFINKSAIVYAGAGYGESTTDCVYAGRRFIVENGKVLLEGEKFSSGVTISDIDCEYLLSEKAKNKMDSSLSQVIEFSLKTCNFALTRAFEKFPFVPSEKGKMQDRAELILDIQANGLKRRIEHVNAKTVVIGVSGGLDSTLALIVAVRAMKLLGRNLKDIIAVTMPCFGTTGRTKNNAVNLANGLGVTLKEINIKKSVLSHFEDIGQDPTLTDVTYENSQARERTQVLMDYANRTGGIVVGTGDLSELALGWATYNGDHMSMYGVNATVPKTLLRYLVGFESSKSKGLMKKTLDDILDTPVSPELVPPKEGEIAQKTEDIVGPYTLHDFYLYYAIRRSYGPKKIFFIAKNTFKGEYDEKTLFKWLKNFYNRFFTQQFKRSCVPDGVKVGSVSLSPRGDFSMPSDAYRLEWLKEIEEIKID